MQQLAIEIGESLPASFERIARTHPSRMAIGGGEWQPTYEELNARANALAHGVLHRGGALGDRVAILMAHDAPQIAAMIAVFKAGRIAVVLNPSDPPGRLAQLVKDADTTLILTDEARRTLAQELAARDRAVIDFEHDAGIGEDTGVAVAPDDVAFLTYTSGSTGVPKAVMQTHGQILVNVAAQSRVMCLTPDDRITLLASIGGSQGLTTAWCALSNGASLWPYRVADKGVGPLAGWINDNGITVYISAPSLFRHFMRSLDDRVTFPHIHVVKLGAERATAEDLAGFRRHFSDRCALIHTLSCTEVGNIAAMRFSHRDAIADGPLPVGRVQEGIEVVLLDDSGTRVGAGEMGEVVVRGRYLAAGYWRNEALTAERFSQDPQGEGVRLFRSGDLGRFDAKGLLQLCGRKDSLIKIRGYRVEPSEVEQALLALPGVERAAVYGIDVGDSQGPRLAASIVFHRGKTPSAAALRRALSVNLPNYMVPSSFAFLESLPLTANGKIDREFLRRNHPRSYEGKEHASAKTETEVLLAEIWAEAFGLSQVGRQDDFFELGGDSLIAAAIAARIYNALHVEFGLGMFTSHPMLSDFAAAIDEFRRTTSWQDAAPMVRVPRDGRLALSFVQERTWVHSQTPVGSAQYTGYQGYRILGPLDAGVLRDSLTAIASRHEILRTVYPSVNGTPRLVIHPPAPVPLSFLDFSGLANAEEQARQLYRRAAEFVFDTAKGPLILFCLIKIRDGEHWLLRTSHHILFDAASWTIFFRELSQFYEARLYGRASPLPQFEPLQYVDYAAWQRQAINSERITFRKAIEWWRDEFAGLPPRLRLPFIRQSPPAEVKPGEGRIRWGLDRDSAQGLDELRRKSGATFFMSRLAVFAALLAEECGSPDMILGTTMTHRTHLATQHMIGYFSNTLALRLRYDPKRTFLEWLVAVRDVTVNASGYSFVPFEELMRQLWGNHIPVPELDVTYTINQEPVQGHFAGLTLESLPRPSTRRHFGFTFICNEYNEQDDCRVTFDANIYDPVRVRAFIERYRRLAALVSHRPDVPLHRLLEESGIEGRRPPEI